VPVEFGEDPFPVYQMSAGPEIMDGTDNGRTQVCEKNVTGNGPAARNSNGLEKIVFKEQNSCWKTDFKGKGTGQKNG
jgi:hypothetical protein